MPQLNPTIFRLKLADWYRHSETLLPFTPQLTEEEREASTWLMEAWREYAYSADLATAASDAIAAMAVADQAHAGNIPLKNASAAFRGIATVVYCTDADVFAHFQRELCNYAGIPIPTQLYGAPPTPAPAPTPTPPPPSNPPSSPGAPTSEVTILSVALLSANKDEQTICGDNHILTTTYRIQPRIKVTTPYARKRIVTFFVTITDPSGQMLRNVFSPQDCTFTSRETFTQSDVVLHLSEWGENRKRLFSRPGMWTISVKPKDGVEVSAQFLVEPPTVSAIPLKVTDIKFLPEGESELSDTIPEYTAQIQPVATFANPDWQIHEISYAIHKGSLQVLSLVPANIWVKDSIVHLPIIRHVLDKGDYTIKLTIDGRAQQPVAFKVESTVLVKIFTWVYGFFWLLWKIVLVALSIYLVVRLILFVIRLFS